MAVRVNAMLDLTACIPQMAHHVHSVEEYVANLRSIKEDLLRIAIDSWGTTAVNISLNTRDDLARPEVYLTLTGSSIESGDEGLVGRGNRANGLIASFRPYSVEAGCGKNPVYHVGKVYTVLANDLASEIFSLYGIPCVVALVSQSGSSLTRPWKTMIGIPPGYSLGPTVADLVRERLDGVRAATRRIVAGDVRLF